MKSFIAIVLASIALLSFSGRVTSSIYTQHFTSLTGNEVYLSQYQGTKKMLLVNMASGSDYAATQIPQMEQLYQQYKDNLVVIGFFSNDFGNEPRNDSTLSLLLQDTYHTTFPASKIIGVQDSTGNTHPLYTWLQNQSENGNSSSKVNKDFQKFLIDTDGTIVGIFSGSINPMDSTIIQVVTQ